MEKLNDQSFDAMVADLSIDKKLVLFTSENCTRCKIAKVEVEKYLKTNTQVKGFIVDITEGRTADLFGILELNKINSLPVYGLYNKEGKQLALKAGIHTEEGLNVLCR